MLWTPFYNIISSINPCDTRLVCNNNLPYRLALPRSTGIFILSSPSLTFFCFRKDKLFKFFLQGMVFYFKLEKVVYSSYTWQPTDSISLFIFVLNFFFIHTTTTETEQTLLLYFTLISLESKQLFVKQFHHKNTSYLVYSHLL